MWPTTRLPKPPDAAVTRITFLLSLKAADESEAPGLVNATVYFCLVRQQRFCELRV